MRRELKKRGVQALKVVYSREPAIKPAEGEEPACEAEGVWPSRAQEDAGGRRRVPGSNAFVPATAGLIIAGEVIKDIIG